MKKVSETVPAPTLGSHMKSQLKNRYIMHRRPRSIPCILFGLPFDHYSSYRPMLVDVVSFLVVT